MSEPQDCTRKVTVYPDGTTATVTHCGPPVEAADASEEEDEEDDDEGGPPTPFELVGGLGKRIVTGIGSAVASVLPEDETPGDGS